MHESIRNQFSAEKGPFLRGSPALTCNAHAHMVTRLRLFAMAKERKRQATRKRKREEAVHNDPWKLVNSQGRSVALPRRAKDPYHFRPLFVNFFFLFFFIFLCCSSIVYSIDIYYYLLATNLIRYLSIRFADRDGTVSDSSGNIVFFSRCDFAAMLRCHPCRSQTPDPCAALNERSSSLCPFLGRFGTVIRRGKGGRWGSRRACADGCCTPLTPPFHRNRSKPRCPSVCLIEI